MNDMLVCPRCPRNNFLTQRSLRRHIDSHKRRRTSRDPEKGKKRAIGKCSDCKKVVRADVVPHPVVSRFTGRHSSTGSPIWEPSPAVQGTVVKGPFAAPKESKSQWLVMCSHFGGCRDGHIRFQTIRFVERSVPTKCNASCRSAKGPNCDCECGGEQHGAAFS